jgi:hypothetical protein
VCLGVNVILGKIIWKILYSEVVDVEKYCADVEYILCYRYISSTVLVLVTFHASK